MRTSSHQTMKHTYGRASTHRAALPASFENASVKRAIIRYMLGEEEAGGVFDAKGCIYIYIYIYIILRALLLPLGLVALDGALVGDKNKR